MIRDENVKRIVKQTCKPGKRSKKDFNQVSMIRALVQIKNILVEGYPEEDVLCEYLMIEKRILDIIEETLEALTPVYD